VLMHDDYVDRTTNGHGLLCEMTLDEVKTLDAGSWFGVDYSNERIPMLIEVFAEFGNSTNYHIDLRWPKACPDTPRELAVDKTVWAIQAFGLHRKVAFTVEDPVILQRLKSKLPDSLILASINVLYTLAPLSSMWAFVDKTGADGVSAHFLMPMLKNVLVEANKRKKKVFIYTVDSLYVSRWLECLGVDAIVTNIPEKIVDNAKCPIYRGKFNDDKYHTRVRSLHGATATNATASDGGRRSIDDATEGEWVPL